MSFHNHLFCGISVSAVTGLATLLATLLIVGCTAPVASDPTSEGHSMDSGSAAADSGVGDNGESMPAAGPGGLFTLLGADVSDHVVDEDGGGTPPDLYLCIYHDPENLRPGCCTPMVWESQNPRWTQFACPIVQWPISMKARDATGTAPTGDDGRDSTITGWHGLIAGYDVISDGEPHTLVDIADRVSVLYVLEGAPELRRVP